MRNPKALTAQQQKARGEKLEALRTQFHAKLEAKKGFVVSTTPEAIMLLDQLVNTGLYGETREKVAEELLRAKLREMQHEHDPESVFKRVHNMPQPLIGLGDIRVIIMNDDSSWFAQGLEIDFATEGGSLEDVQERFVADLCETIKTWRERKLVDPSSVAPPDVWWEILARYSASEDYVYVARHTFAKEEAVYLRPFSGLVFFHAMHAAR